MIKIQVLSFPHTAPVTGSNVKHYNRAETAFPRAAFIFVFIDLISVLVCVLHFKSKSSGERLGGGGVF